LTPLQGTIGHPLAWLSRVTSPAFPAPDPVARTSMPNGMIATARLALAAAALIIMYVDLAESERYVTVAVALYTVYSALLYVLWLRGRRPVAATIEHLADVGWSVVLMALSNGANRIFFASFFFFATLVAAFHWGCARRLRMTVGWILLLMVFGFATGLEPGADFHRYLRRPIYLLMLGYMMACWGDSEVGHRRRLALLKDVTSLSNPRFGVERTIDSLTERLRAFYDADTCLLTIEDNATGQLALHRADRREVGGRPRARPTSGELTRLLSGFPAEQGAVHRDALLRWKWWRPRSALLRYNVMTGTRAVDDGKLRVAVPTASLVTVPFRARGKTVGRLTLTARRPRAFGTWDVDFLLQTLEHVLPTIENIRLVDRLASGAAEAERRRIAGDIHDSVIQPYVGLQMGLAAMHRKVATGGADLESEIDRLLRLTDVGIADLRDQMSALTRGSGEPGGSLVGSLRRYAEKFTEATTIAVRVSPEDEIRVNDRLAAEVFQMAVEGLSNVRRHTSARGATVALTCREDHLVLRIENDVAAGSAPQPFTPRSISERATALGGHVQVERTPEGSAVVVEIPM